MITDYVNSIERIKTDKRSLLPAIVCVLLLLVIIYSLYVRVRMYMLGLSLWNDEALLVEYIVNRPLGDIFSFPQVSPRSEPFLYLATVKVITMIFGTSEAALRSFSFASLIAMLIAQGLLLRKVFHLRMVYTLFSVAVTSTLLYYMQYSHQLKPYMGDAAFVLIVLFAYYAFREGKLGQGVRSAVILAIIFSVCMLYSSPSAFAAGAVFIVELLARCYRKDRSGIKIIMLGGAIFLVVFILTYLLWLRPVALTGNMIWFWGDRTFDLSGISRDALSHNLSLIRELIEPVWHAAFLTIPFAVAGFLISLAKRNIYTVTIGVFFILLLIASTLEKYPIQNRLWMFLYVIIFIYVFVFIDSLRLYIAEGKAANAARTLIPLGLAVLFLIPNISFPAYGRGEEWTLAPGNQANPIIEYVEENIQDGEFLYAYFTTDTIDTVLRYKIGYDTYRIGNVTHDNIIFGTEDAIGDVETIVDTGGSYVFFYHSYYPLSQDTYVRKMTSRLYERGYMEQIMNVYHTYLYWFTDDLSRVRASAALNVFDVSIEGGSLTGIANVQNTGGTILAPDNPAGHADPDDGPGWDDFGRLLVVLYQADGRAPSSDIEDGIVIGEFVPPIRPGESAEILVGADGLAPGEYTIELVAYGLYSFAELGTSTFEVSIR